MITNYLRTGRHLARRTRSERLRTRDRGTFYTSTASFVEAALVIDGNGGFNRKPVFDDPINPIKKARVAGGT
ncbi:hypothetical protein [Bradyrhizobium sp. WSM1253]|uniref:hypothetical protein n=1 Tax=Bradyrhizobium sp. WSM1253 TaxID=319003 RepID=UPI00025D138F|nr:hypothetical protein [Bradyrhizobium sp. WSM1253]EIG57039.1 hypothetical protein Bra1253DRAFT_01685 [Bradyrhizobium sp. WSM1253]